MQLGRSSFMTHWLTEKEDGLGNDWSCVILYLGMRLPLSLIVSCLMHPRGASDAFGIRCNISVGKGSTKLFVMSS
jgi:hypothetical protein